MNALVTIISLVVCIALARLSILYIKRGWSRKLSAGFILIRAPKRTPDQFAMVGALVVSVVIATWLVIGFFSFDVPSIAKVAIGLLVTAYILYRGDWPLPIQWEILKLRRHSPTDGSERTIK